MDPTRCSAAEGADAAISAWVAEECKRKLGWELSEEEEQLHVDLTRDARAENPDASQQFKIPRLLTAGSNSEAVVETRWMITWEMTGGKENAKARSAPKVTGIRI